ncbi:MAG: TolC family protein [Deltaproteobacteria bacterium]|nr:TolC family protein [Deltaproteobacteria bacterium]
MLFFRTLFFYMVFSLCAVSQGLTLNVSESLDLRKAFGKAMENNPLILQARAAKDKARANVDKSVSAFFPRLDLESGYIRSNNPVTSFSSKLNQAGFKADDFALNNLNHPDFLNEWQSRLVLTQPLFNQGREYIAYKTSVLKRKISDLSFKSTSEAVLFMVEQAYCQALLAKDNVGVLEAMYRTAVAHEKLSQERYKTGLVLKSDVLSARVRKASTEKQLYQARMNLRVAMATLNRTMGINQQKQWTLVPVNNEKMVEGNLPLWIDRAKRFRPEFLAVKNELHIAKYQHRKAMARFLPSFNLKGIYETDRKDLFDKGGDSWTFMATMSINLFNSFADKASVSAAKFETEQKLAKLRDVKASIELDVRKAYYRFRTAKQQLRVATKALGQAIESQRILQRRYENGLALMVELLSADAAVFETRLAKARSRFDARIAWSALKWKSGILGRDLIGSYP